MERLSPLTIALQLKSHILDGFFFFTIQNPLGSIVETMGPSKPSDQEGTDEATESDQGTEQKLSSNGQEVFPCLLQYIVFPPHSATAKRDRTTSWVQSVVNFIPYDNDGYFLKSKKQSGSSFGD